MKDKKHIIMNNIYKSLLALCVIVLLFGACKREPLHDRSQGVQLVLVPDLEEDDSTQWVKPKLPTMMKTILYNYQTGKMVGEYYTGPYGGYLDGVQPGTYTVLSYDFGTVTTRISDEHSYEDALAFVNVITDADYFETTRAAAAGAVLEEPDHLLVGRAEQVVIPFLTVEDTTFTIREDVKTIHDSYYLEIDSLKGVEHIIETKVYLTSHMPSNKFGLDLRTQQSNVLYISSLKPDLEQYNLHTTFCTFGKYFNTTESAYARIEITTTGGQKYRFERDITEQYLKDDHRLIIILNTEVKPLPEGGIIPKVHEWEAIIEDIDLM